ncbi:hypothetical protein LSAT2_023650, partial [Lamellibrachia satsuma]
MTGSNARWRQTRMYTQTINSLEKKLRCECNRSCIGMRWSRCFTQGRTLSSNNNRKKKRLILQAVVTANIRRRNKEAGINREKSAYASLCASKLLIRYYATGMMKEELEISSKHLGASTSPPTSRGHNHATGRILRRTNFVREYFMSDEVSRMLPGKR